MSTVNEQFSLAPAAQQEIDELAPLDAYIMGEDLGAPVNVAACAVEISRLLLGDSPFMTPALDRESRGVGLNHTATQYDDAAPALREAYTNSDARYGRDPGRLITETKDQSAQQATPLLALRVGRVVDMVGRWLAERRAPSPTSPASPTAMAVSASNR